MATAIPPTPSTPGSGPGRRSRFSAQERRQHVERATLQLADGVSFRESAKEVGVSYETFRRWRLELCGSSRLRPVKATKPVTQAVRVDSKGLMVVTSAGHRVEGLELSQVVELIRAVG